MKQDKIRLYADYKWTTLWWVTLLSVFAYVFLEWLFIITKPSVLSMVSFGEKIRIFLFTFSLVALVSYFLIKVVQGTFALLKHKVLKALGLILPTVTLLILSLLLFDNFTYTILGGGIATSSGLFTALYLLLFVDLLILIFLKLNQQLPLFERITALYRTKWAEPLSAFSLVVLLLLTYQPPEVIQKPSINSINHPQSLPHILLITVDGLNADHMSVYGYERDTTPNLRELAKMSLVGENHFSNASTTTGGTISILTSKYPTTTRVIYPPNILRGEDSIEHLPYILRKYGYINYQYSYPYYADATQRNLIEGFNFVNGVEFIESPYLASLKSILDFDSPNFIYELVNRVIDRIRHITFVKPMLDYKALIPDNPDAQATTYGDGEKIEQIIQILTSAESPLFIHLHWMGTHPIGSPATNFKPKEQIFSKGKDINNQQDRDLDFYDDTIVGFDKALGKMLESLKAAGVYNKTIFIITSDHGLWFTNLSRIPLIVHFPNDQSSGWILANTQSIDIAPTILDYLEIPIPKWMEGSSLLQHVSNGRYIISAGPTKTVRGETGWHLLSEDTPPFYSIGSVVLISCDTWYRLRLNERVWESGKVSGSTNTCTPIDEGQAFDAIIQHLRERGFDTSSVEDFSQIQRAAP
jgi:hypothetical protein